MPGQEALNQGEDLNFRVGWTPVERNSLIPLATRAEETKNLMKRVSREESTAVTRGTRGAQ